MASAIDSLDDRTRERVEEARARARPGIVTAKRRLVREPSCRAEGRAGLDATGLRGLLLRGQRACSRQLPANQLLRGTYTYLQSLGGGNHAHALKLAR